MTIFTLWIYTSLDDHARSSHRLFSSPRPTNFEIQPIRLYNISSVVNRHNALTNQSLHIFVLNLPLLSLIKYASETWRIGVQRSWSSKPLHIITREICISPDRSLFSKKLLKWKWELQFASMIQNCVPRKPKFRKLPGTGHASPYSSDLRQTVNPLKFGFSLYESIIYSLREIFDRVYFGIL